MGKTCAFPFCGNVQSKKEEGKHHVQFHSFPLNRPNLITKWLEAMRKTKWTPTISSRLCSDHFTDECYKPTGGPRKLLLPDAIPSVFSFSPRKRNSKIRSSRRRSVQTSKCENSKPVSSVVPEVAQDLPLELAGTVTLDLNTITANSCDSKNVIQNVLIIDSHDKGELNFQIGSIDQSHDKGDNLEYDLELNDNEVCDVSVGHCTEIEGIEAMDIPVQEIPCITVDNTFVSPKSASANRQKLLRRKLKILQLRVKRRDKRIQQLKAMVSELKAKVQAFAKGEDLTSGLEGFTHELLSHAIRNKDAKKNAIRYSPLMKEFSLTLYSHSIKAYEYVRSLLLYLPNPSLIKKWISILNKPRIIETQPVTQLIDNIEIISDIREELIIGSISDLIEIDPRHVDDDSLHGSLQ